MRETSTGHVLGSLCFGSWVVELLLNTLSRGGAAVHLRPKVMDMLVLPAERSGDKEAFINAGRTGKSLADSGPHLRQPRAPRGDRGG